MRWIREQLGLHSPHRSPNREKREKVAQLVDPRADEEEDKITLDQRAVAAIEDLHVFTSLQMRQSG